MADRTVTINSLSKTYSVTGLASGLGDLAQSLTGAIRKVHDFLTVGAAAPLQEAGVAALSVPESCYQRARRRILQAPRTCCSRSSSAISFTCYKPFGACYIMTDIAGFGFPDDVAFAQVSREGGRRGGGAGQQLLQRTGARSDEASLLFLQERTKR